MSGNICAATNSPSPCSKATTTSSTNPAPRGASSPTTPYASHQSHRELGRRSILEADGMRGHDRPGYHLSDEKRSSDGTRKIFLVCSLRHWRRPATKIHSQHQLL